MPHHRITLVIAALLMGGCAGGETQYYVLRPAADIEPLNNHINPQTQPIIALRNLDLPHYLDEQNIVYLLGNGQIERAEQQRWAEPLRDNLRSAMVDSIRKLTGNPRTFAYPLATNIRPERIIDIQISDFAIDKVKQRLLLNANWQITIPKQKPYAPPGHSFNHAYPVNSAHMDDVIRAYQHAINELATAISRSMP